MKKIVILMAATLFTTGLFAQKLQSGSLDFLKNVTTLKTVFTYEGTKVGKETESDYTGKKVAEANAKQPGSGDAWLKTWNSDKANRFEPKFVELFNKNLEGKQLKAGDAGDYTMSVNCDMLEPGYNVGVWRKGASVNMTIQFLDNSGKVVAVVVIETKPTNDYFGTDFDAAYRLQESCAKAGREVAKFLISKAKLK